jgi:hypothetical protein
VNSTGSEYLGTVTNTMDLWVPLLPSSLPKVNSTGSEYLGTVTNTMDLWVPLLPQETTLFC